MSSVKCLNEILKTRGEEAALGYAKASKMDFAVKLMEAGKWNPDFKNNKKKKIKNRMPDDEWAAKESARRAKQTPANSRKRKTKKIQGDQVIRLNLKGNSVKKDK